LLKRINLIWVVQSPLRKYSGFRFTQITFKTIAVSSHSRGVSRSSRTRDGMRWTLRVPLTNGTKADGRSRVVLTPRRWCQVGEGIFTNDGGKRARSPGRARSSPLKPLRAGMPGCSGGLVVTNARAYYTPRAAAGASAPGIPHALMGRTVPAQLGRIAPRGREAIS
jgi:hypothetical protein